MRAFLLLAIVFLVWCQETGGKVTTEIIADGRDERIKSDLQKRNASDIWNSIKNTANRAWEYVKSLANNAKKKVTDWIAKIRVKAQQLGKAFEERLNKMKDRVNEMIEKIMETGENVKKCVQERKEEIDEILKNILRDVTKCISNNLNYLNKLSNIQMGSISNQTEVLKVIQNEVNVCFKKYEDNDEIEECIQNIRKDIYKNMEVTEDHIYRNHTETKGATDDIMNTIVECTTDGIIKSTTIIADETINIIECASQG